MHDPTTIENTPHGAYLLRCRECGDTYELDSKNCLGQALWVFTSLCKGFAEQHQDCSEDGDDGPPDQLDGLQNLALAQRREGHDDCDALRTWEESDLELLESKQR